MIPSEREHFNANFTPEKYAQFLDTLERGREKIPFRVAETPVFIPESLQQQLKEAGEEIIAFIKSADFKKVTDRAIPPQWRVPNENAHPHFLTFDFGICLDAGGSLKPMLIEMQGFPSLYGFQSVLAEKYKESYQLNNQYTPFFDGLSETEYVTLLNKILVGEHQPEEVVLMDVDALGQKTAIDFHITREITDIQILSLDQIYTEGRKLFYLSDGKKVPIKRIYNRLIFDELDPLKPAFTNGFDPRRDFEVEWITHPNWFYRISKFTLPFLTSKYIPRTHFLNELKQIPDDLENYVLKPLFSFAGQGVIIDVSEADIAQISDPENWILQEKVVYTPAIKSPNGGIKVEIRLMYLWADGEEPKLCINLVRLSRGKMIGVRYNQNFDWVGGSVGLMK